VLDGLVERPVEGVERLVLGKLRGGDATFDPAVSPTGRLFAEEPIDGLERGESLPLGDVERVVELFGGDRDPEDGQVLEDPVT
jgi:hypothetical protein